MTFTVWHIVGVSVIVAIVAAVIAIIRTRRYLNLGLDKLS